MMLKVVKVPEFGTCNQHHKLLQFFLIKRNFRIERGNCVCEDDDDELVRQRRVGRECLFLDFLRKIE
jgi:hypothetical protein